jgi:hypothetical protein
MAVPYTGYRIIEEVYMKYERWWRWGGEGAILISLWRQNEGGTEKNFSRQDAPPHSLTAAITRGIPPLPS